MNEPGRFSILFALVVIGLSSAVHAAPVQVVVTSVAGRSVYINQGRSVGIVPDLRVRFFPTGAAAVEGVIIDVSASSARVEMLQGGTLPSVGTIGEVIVPEMPAIPTTVPTSQPTTLPTHPPWQRQEDPRTPDMPLLAPAFGTSPAQRSSTFHGRAFTEFDATFDRGADRDNEYYFGRAGTAFTITNPFLQGGELRFDGEMALRDAEFTSTGAIDDSDFILNQLSYAIGTDANSPYRLELGRFPSYYLPEIGLVDGVEGALRMKNGLNVGAGVGAYPLSYPDREGEDLGFHVFLDYASLKPRPMNATLGYQKTWHDGEPDSDVLIARASTWLSDELWVFGSAQADFYSGGDALKSSDFELTQAMVQARYTPDASRGASILASHYVWADLKRNEFQPLPPPELFTDGRVDRVELSVWQDIATNVRPTAQVHYFNDETGDGYGGELDLDWTNFQGLPVDLHGALFYNKGSFIEDIGMRSELRFTHSVVDGFIGYEYVRYSYDGTQTPTEDLSRQTIRAGVSKQFGNWYWSTSGDWYFDDADDAISVNTYLEYRW